MKILLIHTAHRRGQGPSATLELMALPQGLLALGALLQDNGHLVEVVHLGLEQALDPTFELESLVRSQAPDLAGISLHWHHGALDARQAAAAARRGGARFVVLGGITATLFARELLEQWQGVDAVVRGDGEQPLLALVQALEPAPGPLEQRLARVPNLSWRNSGEVVDNPLDYVAGPGELERLCFTRYPLLRHHRWYSGQISLDPRVATLSGQAMLRRFNLPISRGCARDCPRCGGARSTLGPATGRPGATFAPVEAVARTMGEAVAQGLDTFYISCHPPDHDPGYFLRLFDAVSRAGLRCALEVEAFADLPDRAFLDAFARTFQINRSRIILSPHGSEGRRRRLGIRYPDADLHHLLSLARERGIAVRSHLGIGPPDTAEDLQGVVSLAARLRAEGPPSKDLVPLLDEVDPLSPWTRQPRRFNLHRPNNCLEELLQESRLRRDSPRARVDPGYDQGALWAGWLALRAAALPPGQALTLLRTGAPHPAGHALAWVPRQRLGDDKAMEPGQVLPLDHDAAWVVMLGGPVEPGSLLTLATRVLALFPGAVDLRVGPAAPPVPDGPPAPGPLPALEMLTDGCRLARSPCPATRPGRLFISERGTVRPCLCAPETGGAQPLEALRAAHHQGVQLARRQRGCVACPAQASCPVCIHLGPLPVEAYCAAIRARR